MTRRPLPREVLDASKLEDELAKLPSTSTRSGNSLLDATRARRRADVEGALAMRNRLFGRDDEPGNGGG